MRAWHAEECKAKTRLQRKESYDTPLILPVCPAERLQGFVEEEHMWRNTPAFPPSSLTVSTSWLLHPFHYSCQPRKANGLEKSHVQVLLYWQWHLSACLSYSERSKDSTYPISYLNTCDKHIKNIYGFGEM